MNRAKIIVLIAVLAIVAFVISSFSWQQNREGRAVGVDPKALQRSYSPSMGPENANVTIVEFFDPACEACRAFHPIVKQIMAHYPKDVRLVLKYTTFHKGSDEVVRILEAARLQNLFKPVLEAILEGQPSWASHVQPNIDAAWRIAADSGLNLEKARIDANTVIVDDLLRQDALDVVVANVEKTPTFYVNGRLLTDFGAQQLYDLVTSEVNKKSNSQ